ncbi:DUF2993 domain-containing protein [Actinomyces sp. ZJ308]|uniref:LmeA family phospholipid-binding protein n=1 Tax=Actinomyces sp. ZJ308 TaxID=2708342 RepID=UPI00141F9E55|nr:DUF2993 domain-containing protein [Actinomyces sp. ZJ308]
MRDRGDADLPEGSESESETGGSREAFFEEVLEGDAEERDSAEGGRRRPARRRGRRWMVVLLVLVVVLTAGAVGAEYLVRGQVDAAVRSALPGLSSDARIATRGIVLRQLVGGSLDSLTVDSESLEITSRGEGGGTVTLSDVDVDLSRISLRSPYPAGTVTASATIDWRQVAALAARSHPRMQGMTLKAKRTGTSAQEPGAIQASASLLGLSGEAEIVPSVGSDGSLVLTITSTRMGGEQTGVDVGDDSLLSYVGLDSSQITVPADSLPRGLRPTSAIVTDDGIRLSMAGSRVNLGQM